MAKMIALDPAPSVPLPAEGWNLIATEAGRYAADLVATLQARNGTLQTCQQVPLAHPKKWEAFVQAVADQSGCAAGVIVEAIHTLLEAVEVLLRAHRRPPAGPNQEGINVSPNDRPQVQVNGRFLRHIVTDAVAALVAANTPPMLFMRGSELVRVPPDETHAGSLSVATLRVLLDHAADFVKLFETEDEGIKVLPDRPPRDVCESILAVPPCDDFPRLTSIRSVPVILPDGE